jgi:hypothetical protein
MVKQFARIRAEVTTIYPLSGTLRGFPGFAFGEFGHIGGGGRLV